MNDVTCQLTITSMILTCHTPTTALAIKISKITNGSTNASTPSCSSKRANTCHHRQRHDHYET
ncbi:CLUMA_CG000904, isoform A [Clunio marinus]|uniref:CLUMA_CG000904, isoform A n=1 Tax=Clunio marinus TaxID=568069 RepID=A0A1J1HGH4_9DIPT|nr:CLUMA_CG000904, isoform A [Clunio marinus]